VDELISSICGTPFLDQAPDQALRPAHTPAGASPDIMSAAAIHANMHAWTSEGLSKTLPSPAAASTEEDSGRSAQPAAGSQAAAQEAPAPAAASPTKPRMAAVRITALHVRVEHDENALPDLACSPKLARSPGLLSPLSGKAASPSAATSPDVASLGLRSPLAQRPQSGWQSPAQAPEKLPAEAEPAALAAADIVKVEDGVSSKEPAQAAAQEQSVSPTVLAPEEQQAAATAEADAELEFSTPAAAGPAPGPAETVPPSTAVRLGAAAAAVGSLPPPQTPAAAPESMLSPAAVLARAAAANDETPARGLIRAPANSPMTAEAPNQAALLQAADVDLPTPASVVPFPVSQPLLSFRSSSL
jgi:ribonuclease E